jgi:hypothetical protein
MKILEIVALLTFFAGLDLNTLFVVETINLIKEF